MSPQAIALRAIFPRLGLLLLFAVGLAGCGSLAGWLNTPVGDPIVSDGTVTYPVDIDGDGTPDTWVTAPELPQDPIDVEIPTGEGNPPLTVTIRPEDWAPPEGPTRGSAIVEAISGTLGSVNPLLGFAALAGGQLLLGAAGAAGARRKKSKATT